MSDDGGAGADRLGGTGGPGDCHRIRGHGLGLGLAMIGVLLVGVVTVAASSGLVSSRRPGASPDPHSPVRPSWGGTALRDLADDHDLSIGTAVELDTLRGDRAIRDTVVAQFDVVTPENAMKWSEIHPQRNRYDFRAADAVVEFAETNRLAVRGHALAWHRQNPEWLDTAELDRAGARRLLEAHIATVAGRYAGRVAQWDVVNEPLNPLATSAGDLRPNVWLDTIGASYIADAFHFAAAADPEARLFLNDFDPVGSGAKTEAIVDLAARLVAEGVPIDGVGLQMHLRNDVGFDPSALRVQLHRLAALGLDVAFTEVDVRMELPVDALALARQAEIYGDLLAVCVTAPTCRTFVMWGFTDAASWVEEWYAGEGAATITDHELRPKPAHAALVAVLTGTRGDEACRGPLDCDVVQTASRSRAPVSLDG